MLEKLRDNPRVVVAALVAAGVLAVAVGAGNKDAANDTSAQQDSSTSEVIAEEGATFDSDVAPEDGVNENASAETESSEVMEAEPVAGPVVVKNDEGALKATVRKGDNQTVIVRQMVSDYLGNTDENLSAEQRLFVETKAVADLPRNDVIQPDTEISIDESVIEKLVSDSKNLDQSAISRWAAYL